MLAWAGRFGLPFSFTPSYGTGAAANLAPPWPATVSNVQVTVGGIVAPIFRVDTGEVLFQIPNGAPSSGPADFIVTNPATGQVLAAATLYMQQNSPALYTTNGGGTGQVAANVYDSHGNLVGNGINSVNNPASASAGNIIGLWLT